MKPSQDDLKVIKVVESILTGNFDDQSIAKKKNTFVLR